MTQDPDELRRRLLSSDDAEAETPATKQPQPPEEPKKALENFAPPRKIGEDRAARKDGPEPAAGSETTPAPPATPPRESEIITEARIESIADGEIPLAAKSIPKPESVTHSGDLEAPDELENVPAGDFTPLRDAILAPDRETPPADAAASKGRSGSGKKAEKSEPMPELESKPKRAPIQVRPPSPLTLLMLIGGGVSLAGATIALALGQSGTPVLALGGIGLALVVLFAVVNGRWLRTALSSRSARYSANVATVILTLLGIMVFANIAAYRYHYKIDLSSEGLYSLSPQTLSILDDINRAGKTIQVTAFTPPTSGYRQVIEELMDLYLYHSPKLELTFVDPDVRHEFAESKGINRNPSVLFELGEDRSVVTDMDEPHFTSALLAIRSTQSRLISFLAGHGEADPFSDDSNQSGLSVFKNQLELEGYDVDSLRIPESNGVPAETSLVVIASPQRDLEEMEIDAIEEYLDNGGSIMCFLEPGMEGGLTELLATYGIAFNEGITLDDEKNAFGDSLSPVVLPNYEHPITEALTEGLIFLKAGSIKFTSSTRLPEVSIDSLVRSWPSSWNETTSELVFREGINTREALDLAAIATRNLDIPASDESDQDTPVDPEGEDEDVVDNEAPTPTRVAQVLVVTDGSFIQNANLDRYYNKDFAMNAVNYLTAQHDLISIRSAQREYRPLDLSNVQKNSVFIFSVILIPLLIAGMGGLVWWKRQ